MVFTGQTTEREGVKGYEIEMTGVAYWLESATTTTVFSSIEILLLRGYFDWCGLVLFKPFESVKVECGR